MENYLIYVIKASAYSAAFFIAFKLFMSRDSNFNFRRVYFYLSAALSIVLPLIKLPDFEGSSNLRPIAIDLREFTTSAEAQTASQPETTGIIAAILIAASTILALMAFYRFIEILAIKPSGDSRMVDGIKIVPVAGEKRAFTFFRKIYLSSDVLDDPDCDAVVRHEIAHAKGWHSIDAVFFDLFKCVLWFNPVSWLLQKEVLRNLEFAADKTAAGGLDVAKYSRVAARFALESKFPALINSFSSLTKSRLKMLRKNGSRKSAVWKAALALPIVAALALIFAEPNFAQKEKKIENTREIEAKKAELEAKNAELESERAKLEINRAEIEKKKAQEEITRAENESKKANLQRKEKYFEGNKLEVEKKLDAVFAAGGGDKKFAEPTVQAEFPGGKEAMIEFLQRNIKYPEKALKKGVEGKVLVEFIVDKTGKVTDVMIPPSDIELPQELDHDTKIACIEALRKEAMRVVIIMPQWKPAKDADGNAVESKMRLPIKFKLADKQ